MKNRLYAIVAAALLTLGVRMYTVAEGLLGGRVHGQAACDTLSEFLERPRPQNISPGMLVLLVLIPAISFQEIDLLLGGGSLKRM